MKRFSLIFGLISSITLIFILIILLVLALIDNNKYDMKDSMVFIESISNDYTNKGMGFVYKIEDGANYIVTNYHVVENNNELYVYNMEEKKEKASVLNYDEYTDLAILKIEDKLDLKVVKIGIDDVKINDQVYYFNITERIIDVGTVLSLDNEINLVNSYYNASVVQGNIDNGNSGGPVFNDENEVIGLLALKEDNSNNGLYISIENVNDIVTKLENQTLIRPNLGGVFTDTSNVEVLNNYGISQSDIIGVVVIEVNEGYPLMRAGILKGDIITKINDVIIENVSQLQKIVYSYNIGDTITLEYYRNNILYNGNVNLEK